MIDGTGLVPLPFGIAFANRLWAVRLPGILHLPGMKVTLSMAGTTTRRSFLSLVTTALMAVIGLLLAVPAISYIWSPLRRHGATDASEEGFADAGVIADLPIGQWRLVTIEVVRRDGWQQKARTPHAVWVRRTEAGVTTVLSPICPHLGCQIEWHPGRTEFVCPCHKGVFTSNGQLVSGPPPRGMDELPSKKQAGRLRVQWRDFKSGVAERESVDL
jgi:quinol---cytochrome c reductase iron-sulfur subunit, bacillus type